MSNKNKTKEKSPELIDINFPHWKGLEKEAKIEININLLTLFFGILGIGLVLWGTFTESIFKLGAGLIFIVLMYLNA